MTKAKIKSNKTRKWEEVFIDVFFHFIAGGLESKKLFCHIKSKKFIVEQNTTWNNFSPNVGRQIDINWNENILIKSTSLKLIFLVTSTFIYCNAQMGKF